MERDGVLAHGMSYFLNESFLVRGDEFYLAVCNKTGAVAIYNESKNLFLSPYADGPINFVTNPDGTQNIKNLSKFGRSFSILRVPYSLKLLIQELQVMNVQMRIVTDDNVDQLLSMSYSDNINKLLQVGNKELKDVTKEYSQKMNAIIYKESNTVNRENIEEPVIPEPVTITSEEQLGPIEPYSPPYAPHGPDSGSIPSFELGNNTPGAAEQYDSPPYAPGTPPVGTPPYAPTIPPGTAEDYMHNLQQTKQFTRIPIQDATESSSSSVPSLEKTTPPQKEILINPNILDVDKPNGTPEEEKKDEESNDSETKRINISEDTTTSSNPDDFKKITF
jgi:hypothetical protein